ncbi:MAG TPA: DUF4394 domain-containing protein [Burkholderiaceae bacterium]|jgi:hypothetical protein|nr:DUF4394 domain-containing protein [Burkholderiaceae bacterium]
MNTSTRRQRPLALACLLALAGALLAGCAHREPADGAARKETAFAVTVSHELVSFNAGQPGRLLSRRQLIGLADGEKLVGIDFRVARGQLFALSDRARLYRIDTESATLAPVGSGIGTALSGTRFGFDFNPTVDRIRVVSDSGQNLRVHPDTGGVVDSDPQSAGLQLDGPLAYVPGDPNAGQAPRVIAAAYTYNKENEKITTNYALDAQTASLVVQGSIEGSTPVVSPNTGRLRTVGPLRAGAFDQAAFDISDLTNTGFAALTRTGARESQWYLIDLATGRATGLGTIGAGAAVVGVAIEP